MEQKIPPEILQRQELTLIGQVEMHLTLAHGGPCISFNRVYASLIHKLRPNDNHASNGDAASLVKIDRSSNVGWKPVLRLE